MLPKNFPARALTVVLATTASMAMAMGGQPKSDDAAVLERIAPVAKVDVVPAAGTANKGPARTGEQLFNTVCVACHGPASAVPTAPKMGDKAAWAPRIGVGLDVLVKSATVGKNAMPPKGGSDASEEELTRAIVYMTGKSGANFKEPAAGAKPASNERNPEQIAQTVCFKCHETGEKGAPKLSDQAAWTQRGSKGLDAVTKTVIRGHGNMPARGGLADLTDTELKGVIAHMFKKVGSEIK